jgi:hypothetical protein
MRGLVECCVLVFMHVETRRVFLSPVTVQPDAKWMAQQARNFLLELGDDAEGAILLRDRDAKYAATFDGILESGGVRPHVLPVASPNLNAYVERWIGSLKFEALNHFVFLGVRHVQHVVDSYVRHYKVNHSARGYLPPAYMPPNAPATAFTPNLKNARGKDAVQSDQYWDCEGVSHQTTARSRPPRRSSCGSPASRTRTSSRGSSIRRRGRSAR